MNYQKARRLTMKTEWEFNTQKNRISVGSKANNMQAEPEENGTIFEILESKLKNINMGSNELFCLERLKRNKVIMNDMIALKWEIDSNWRMAKMLPQNQVKSVQEQCIKANKLSEKNNQKRLNK